MADTYNGICKKCERDGDLIEGICASCDVGEYWCDCGNQITEHELDIDGICRECK